MLKDKKIIVAVTGSIAAYKAALLVRLLKKEGAEVKVILTEGARKFVTDLTFSNLSQNDVFADLWDGTWSEHVHLGVWADLMVVAPATANTLAKMAHGHCDNALTAVYLSARCPVFVAPAMDADMHAHPATQANFDLLQKQGVIIIPSESGFLASGLEGNGRMAEPHDILGLLLDHYGPKPFAGRKIMISAGPTQEAIDPVRFISNHSTGTMGWLLAKTAMEMGAEVTLVTGKVKPDVDYTGKIVPVVSAADMYDAVHAESAEQDIIIMAAAVADYTPAEMAENKVKKKSDDWHLPLVRTKDILHALGEKKPAGQILVGFAMETQNEFENASAKLKKKNLDYIVLNSLRDKGAGFGPDTNKIILIDKNGQDFRYPVKTKAEVAFDILQKIAFDNGFE